MCSRANMHRQSLGSSTSKLHLHTLLLKDECPEYHHQALVAEKEKNKTQKPKITLKSPHEKYIHFIPILTLVCFLILYLSSHNPSPNDMAGFNFKHFPKPTDSEDGIDKFEQILKMKSGDVLAIRSLKNLEEEEQKKIANQARKNQLLHRKIADF